MIAIARQAGRDMDAAIVGILFQAALRRSEAAALEWRDIKPAQDVPGALRIRVRRSKTDQAGAQTDIRLVKNGTVAKYLRAGEPHLPRSRSGRCC
jgi:integrase